VSRGRDVLADQNDRGGTILVPSFFSAFSKASSRGSRPAFDRRPVVLRFGGMGKEVGGKPADPDENVLFMIRCVCRLCGHTMLFDSEQHHHRDEPVLEGGP
jgi:hypothetical protein